MCKRNHLPPQNLTNPSSSNSNKGILDGRTIVRFTHATKHAGGIEQELELLNNVLLQRNKMTIIQMYSITDNKMLDEEIEEIGQGKLISVPILETDMGVKKRSHNWLRTLLIKLNLDVFVRYHVMYSPFCSFWVRKKSKFQTEGFCHDNAGEAFKGLVTRFNIDLVAFHSLSSSDSTEIINIAMNHDIPYVIQHHFNNWLLKHPITRGKIEQAAGVGGVSNANLPGFLKHSFENLSSGIDTDFFKVENAKKLNLHFQKPIILLASRIVPGKGHCDIIRAAAILKKKGLEVKVVFAGRNDSPEFKKTIEELVVEYGLSDTVFFAGQLSLIELRDWYAASKVVVLPSDTEGLPRVLLESQAMKIPPVAYGVGGVSEALENEKTGFIVKKGKIKKLAARVQELLSDEQQRLLMGEAGREFVNRQFSLAAMAARHEAFYTKAIL